MCACRKIYHKAVEAQNQFRGLCLMKNTKLGNMEMEAQNNDRDIQAVLFHQFPNKSLHLHLKGFGSDHVCLMGIH